MPQVIVSSSSGLFISFEGIDGAGKSTHLGRLVQAFRGSGRVVTQTREPGGTALAEQLRELILKQPMDALTEALLIFAARRDHLEKTIRPAVARGEVVITDRFADSTRMYQGLTRGNLAAEVDALHALMIGIEPDLTFLIDIPPEAGLARATARAGAEMRFEGMGLEVQTRARNGFLALAARHPARFRVIDGHRPEAEVAAEVQAIAHDWLTKQRQTA